MIKIYFFISSDAELRSNGNSQTRVEFMSSDKKNVLEDKLVIDLLYGGILDIISSFNINLSLMLINWIFFLSNLIEKNQKFLFMVYKNMNEFLTTTTASHAYDEVISNIISVQVNDISVIDNLKQNPIQITFMHKKNLSDSRHDGDELSQLKTHVCGYWHYDKM